MRRNRASKQNSHSPIATSEIMKAIHIAVSMFELRVVAWNEYEMDHRLPAGFRASTSH